RRARACRGPARALGRAAHPPGRRPAAAARPCAAHAPPADRPADGGQSGHDRGGDCRRAQLRRRAEAALQPPRYQVRADPGAPTPKNPPPPPAPNAPVTKFKVTIPADLPVGLYDVRVANGLGVSNPRAFAVGDQAEVLEKEPNNDVPEAQRVELNTTINGNLA